MSKPRASATSYFVLALVLVLVGVAAVRVTGLSSPQGSSEQSATSSVPAFVSASFPDGDALAGLGADWTFVRQSETDITSGDHVSGVSSTRQSVIRAVTNGTTLGLEEGSIRDQVSLDKWLQSKEVHKLRIAGRDVYLVSSSDSEGSQGLILVGSSTTLLIQDVDSTTWPSALSSEVLSYIASVRVQ